MRRALLLAAILLALLPGLVAGQSAPRPATFVFHHVDPDPRAGAPDADPFSATTGAPEARALPRTLFDRVEEASDAPEGAPDSVPAHFREAQRLLLLRERTGTTVTLRVDARLASDALLVDATAEGLPEGARLTATLVEDQLAYEGASGVRVHRFVARAHADEPGAATWSFPLDAGWARDRLGVVIAARAPDGEVLQSARWNAGQAGPTVQVEKAVLVEHVTATWCVPCGPRDEALVLLATQFGAGATEGGAERYQRPAGALTVAGLVLGAFGAFLALRRRAA